MPHSPRPITVVGGGYVGLVSAVGLAGLGHSVRLVETGEARLAMLRAGRIPIHEAGLQEAFDAAVAAGRLAVSGSIETGAGMILVCVGTPIDEAGRSDLSQLDSALDAIRDGFGPDDILVIRSTLPVGGTRRSIAATRLPTARVFTNPEFLRQGTAVADFARPSRIVVGRFPDADPAALAAVVGLYDAIDAPRHVVDVEAAEIIKNGANAFLALKLSFTNEIASLCEEAGADVDEVLDGIGADPRIGRTYMQPSYGFGGSCLPKELATLAVAGRTLGLPMYVTTAAAEANLAAQARFAERIAATLDGPAGRTVGLLGLAFKAGTDDTRDSPALRLAGWLLDRGAIVRAYDPAAGPKATAQRARPGRHRRPRRRRSWARTSWSSAPNGRNSVTCPGPTGPAPVRPRSSWMDGGCWTRRAPGRRLPGHPAGRRTHRHGPDGSISGEEPAVVAGKPPRRGAATDRRR